MRMNRFWMGLVFLILLATACSPSAGGPQRVDGKEARTLVSEGAQLVDVRTVGEYRGGHIDGAANIPIDQLPGRTGELSKDKPVVVYCQSGARSARAASLLRERGYDVFDLGGIGNW